MNDINERRLRTKQLIYYANVEHMPDGRLSKQGLEWAPQVEGEECPERNGRDRQGGSETRHRKTLWNVMKLVI